MKKLPKLAVNKCFISIICVLQSLEIVCFEIFLTCMMIYGFYYIYEMIFDLLEECVLIF